MIFPQPATTNAALRYKSKGDRRALKTVTTRIKRLVPIALRYFTRGSFEVSYHRPPGAVPAKHWIDRWNGKGNFFDYICLSIRRWASKKPL